MTALYGIVLAAGASTRMGSPKALLSLGGEPLVCAHVHALSARCDVVRVVIGAHANQVSAVLPAGVEIIENRDWAHTQTRDSLCIGLKGLPQDARVVVTPVDTPPVSTRVLDALLYAEGPAVPQHKGQPGHPVVVQAGPAMEALANGTLRDHTATAMHISVEDPSVLLGFNTPEEWAAWAEIYSSPRTSRS